MKTPKPLYSRLALATSVTLVVGYFVVYAAWTNLIPEDADGGKVLTSALLKGMINSINDIGTRTDGIVSNGASIGIGTNVSEPFRISTSGTGGLNLKDPLGEPYLQAWNCAAEGACLILYKNGGVTRAAEIRGDGSSTYFNDGNVGIGTTTPQAKLDVNGPVKILRSDAIPFTCDSTKVGSIYLDSDVGGNDVLCLCTYSSSSYAWRTVTAVACD